MHIVYESVWIHMSWNEFLSSDSLHAILLCFNALLNSIHLEAQERGHSLQWIEWLCMILYVGSTKSGKKQLRESFEK